MLLHAPLLAAPSWCPYRPCGRCAFVAEAGCCLCWASGAARDSRHKMLFPLLVMLPSCAERACRGVRHSNGPRGSGTVRHYFLSWTCRSVEQARHACGRACSLAARRGRGRARCGAVWAVHRHAYCRTVLDCKWISALSFPQTLPALPHQHATRRLQCRVSTAPGPSTANPCAHLHTHAHLHLHTQTQTLTA